MSILYNDLTLTSYPNSLDNIVSLLNITTSDSEKVRNFQQFILDGNFTQAQAVLNTIQDANRKIISAEYFNTIRDAILALERFYKSDIKPYLEQQQETWQNIVNQLSFMSDYNSNTQYKQNNMVLYTVNGQELIFIATENPPIGTVPTNTQYWRQLTVKGQRGSSGPGATFLYDWAENTQYQPQDVVVYQNRWFVATIDNINQPPFVGSQYWQVVLQLISLVYPVQAEEPIGQDVGQMWFQILE